MTFQALSHRRSERTRWEEVTHIRLVGRSPDTPLAIARREVLKKLADVDGVLPLHKALASLEPVRNLRGGREASVRSDLRNWSNPASHGNNSVDKGWLELGRLTDTVGDTG